MKNVQVLNKMTNEIYNGVICEDKKYSYVIWVKGQFRLPFSKKTGEVSGKNVRALNNDKYKIIMGL